MRIYRIQKGGCIFPGMGDHHQKVMQILTWNDSFVYFVHQRAAESIGNEVSVTWNDMIFFFSGLSRVLEQIRELYTSFLCSADKTGEPLLKYYMVKQLEDVKHPAPP